MSAAAHLRLDPACTLREITDLHFSLLAAEATADPYVIDAGAVERVDTAGLQLLTAFVRQRAAAGRGIEWSAVSPELARGARGLGLEQALCLPVTTGSAGG